MRLGAKFEDGKRRAEILRLSRETLEGYIKQFYAGNQKTYENLRIGLVQGSYETVISRSAIFFYLQLEQYIGDVFGEEGASYWSEAIFHGVYDYLQELDDEYDMHFLPEIKFSESEAAFWFEWLRMFARIGRKAIGTGEMTEEEFLELWEEAKEKVRSVKEHTFEHFYSGKSKFGVENFDSGLARWLVSKDGDFQIHFGSALAQYVELAMRTLIDDVEHGVTDKWDELDIDLEPAGRIYAHIKYQMDVVDQRRILEGEEPLFKLPQYGV